MTNAWNPLKPGDKIAVVNACMIDSQSESHADAYKELFASWGYGINGDEELKTAKGSRLWSGTLEERAHGVIEALMNPENKAICLLVGGDGANEVMKLVGDYHAQELAKGEAGRPLPKRGIPVIGLSNNTTLLNPLARLGIISPIQGKLDAAIALPSATKEENKPARERENKIIASNAEALRGLLAGEMPELSFGLTPLNAAASNYRGEEEAVEIVGGCNFHVIESARTPFQLETRGKFLALEGPEEQCSVKETISGLQREGMLDGVKALFLGHIAGFDSPEKQAEVRAAAAELNIPVFVGLPWGHISPGAKRDVYLPLNTDASLTISDEGIPTLNVSTFRTQENLDAAYARELPIVVNKATEVAEEEVITSMEIMLQDPAHPSLARKDVTLAVTPKYGEPISHMMSLSQGLAALLHKGSLVGMKSLSVDLSGLYDESKRPLYSNLKGKKLTPPHIYGAGLMREVNATEASYSKELGDFLQDFSKHHLGGIPITIGRDLVVNKIADKVGITVDALKASYQKPDGTARIDASAIVTDYNNGAVRSGGSKIAMKKNISISDRFSLEEKLARDGVNIGDGIFYAECDSTGKDKFGILQLNNPPKFLKPEAIFIGRFDEESRQLEGEYRMPGYIIKQSVIGEKFSLTQIDIESGNVRRFLCDKDYANFQEQDARVIADPLRMPFAEDVSALFLETQKHFEELRNKRDEEFATTEMATDSRFSTLRTAMKDRELLYSDTMLSELSGRVLDEQKAAHKHLREGIINRRIADHEKTEYGLEATYGNCREYASQIQELAMANGLEHCFTLFGRPDHVFNVTVVEDKLFLIDGWNGDLMCEFTPENFYQHSSLHGIFDLQIHNDSWKKLSQENPAVADAQQKLTSKIQEIAKARFDPEIQAVINFRLDEKIATLNPADDYFAENARELGFITDYFGLEKLHEKIPVQVSYVVTPPDYEAFKADLLTIERDDPNVIFDDEKKSVIFNSDDRDMMKYKFGFEEGKYPFFCGRHPKDYDESIVKRFENGVEKTFAQARQELVAWYHDLDEPKATTPKNMVISETHFDLEPKKKLVEIILELGDENTVICLENFSRSLNDLAATWLKSGDEKMPEELEEALLAQGDCYAKQLDGHDFSDEYLDQLRNSYKNILLAAKITGASVMFIENDASLTDDDVSRHAALCKTMAGISASNPAAKIIVLVGGAHEEKSATQPFVLSDMIGGASHHIRGEEFGIDFFVKDGFNHIDRGDKSTAKMAFDAARKMDPDFMDKLLIQERIIAERVIGKDRVLSMGR